MRAKPPAGRCTVTACVQVRERATRKQQMVDQSEAAAPAAATAPSCVKCKTMIAREIQRVLGIPQQALPDISHKPHEDGCPLKGAARGEVQDGLRLQMFCQHVPGYEVPASMGHLRSAPLPPPRSVPRPPVQPPVRVQPPMRPPPSTLRPPPSAVPAAHNTNLPRGPTASWRRMDTRPPPAEPSTQQVLEDGEHACAQALQLGSALPLPAGTGARIGKANRRAFAERDEALQQAKQASSQMQQQEAQLLQVTCSLPSAALCPLPSALCPLLLSALCPLPSAALCPLPSAALMSSHDLDVAPLLSLCAAFRPAEARAPGEARAPEQAQADAHGAERGQGRAR